MILRIQVQDITEDKSVFYAFCAKIGVPTPKLLALFFKDSSGLHWEGKPLFGEDRWADFFENDCPDEFVIKPSKGVYGDGIIFVEKGKAGFSGKKLFKELATNSRYDSFVVQECLSNHPDIMEINSKKGLQTLRIITFIDKSLEVHVIHAYLKLIVGEARIDNHKSGETGNLFCQIDINKGTLGVPLLITDNGPLEFPKHPETNKDINGLILPQWKETLAFTKKVAPHFLPMRSIGWDVAISEEGIRIIEGNARWDPPKFGGVNHFV
jgi:hypothetical protein